MKKFFYFLVILGLTLSINSSSFSQDFGPAQLNQTKILQDVTGDFNPELASGVDISPNYNFDVVTGSWVPRAPSVKAQSRTFCVYLNLSGTEYIYQFGGGAGVELTSIARHDIAANTWTLLAHVLTRAVSSGTAINDGDSVIYIFGGNSPTTLGSTQKYNVVTGVTTVLADMPNLITDAAVVEYQDSLVYVIGGGTGLFGAGYINNVNVYNKKTNTYAAATAYPIAAGMQGCGIDGNRIVVAAGWNGVTGVANAYVGTIDPSNHLIISWVAIPNYPGGGVTRTASYYLEQEDASDKGPIGRGVVFTGGALLGATLQNKTYFYNTVCNQWDSTDNLPVARSNMKAAGRRDSVVWVVAGFTTVGVGNTDRLTVSSIVCGAPTVDVYSIPNIYALGKVPTPWGCPDTLSFRLRRLIPNPNPILIRVRIFNLDPNPGNLKVDSTFIINRPDGQPFDTLIPYVRPWNITQWKCDSIIIEAIPKPGETVINNNRISWRQLITCDAWNWAQKDQPPDGGVGFNGGVGTFVSCFRNTCPIPVPIWAVDLCFFNLGGAGNQPYRVYIFGDGGGGSPGPILYKSGMLLSPPGTPTPPQRVQHTINPAVQIPPNSRFYVGLVQKGIINLAVCYQSESPVKTGRFFFTADTAGAAPVWTDFGPNTAPFRLDICPRTTTKLFLKAYLEGFFNGTTQVPDVMQVQIRNAFSPYTLVDSNTALLNSSGQGIFQYCRAECDVPYYFVGRHRNHIRTWTGVPQLFNCDYQYNFTDNITKAFGNNMVFVPGDNTGGAGGFAFYTGDVQQDCVVDGADCALVDTDAFNFVTGYVNTDLNGDEIVDASDAAFCDNNAFNFVTCIEP